MTETTEETKEEHKVNGAKLFFEPIYRRAVRDGSIRDGDPMGFDCGELAVVMAPKEWIKKHTGMKV